MDTDRNKQGLSMSGQQCHTSAGSTPKKVFEFLKLPAEIRNMVYWNVLVKRHSCYRFAQPPLTLVNKQIRCESLPVLYGNGLFFAYFGPEVPISIRFQQLPRLVPATPNLAHITKLDIRFSCGVCELPKRTNVEVFIYMREDKSECCSLGNKTLVGEPGLEWKDPAKIEVHYRRLLEDLPSLAGWKSWYTMSKFSAECRLGSVVRTMLRFAERCPAAATWVWMALEWRQTVVERSR